MTFQRAMLIIICFLLGLVVLTSMSGCKYAERVANAVFNVQPEQNDTIIPTPTGQLWQAVKKSDWLVTFSILGIAAGVFAFLNGSKMGIPAIASCCVSLFMALAVARFATYMAVCGMIGSCAAVGISVLVKNRALKEIIFGVQNIKNNIQDDSKENHDNFNLALKEAQKHKSTKKIVQKIKSKAKLKGEL